MEKKLELILAYLLGKPNTDTNNLQNDLEQLVIDPETQDLLERVETLFSQQDDPDWLEAIAAFREGIITPEIEEFLTDRNLLQELDPELVEQFATLSVTPLLEDLDFSPKFPTFAEQFQTQKKTLPAELGYESTVWNQEQGFEWRQIKEKGQLIIRRLTERLSITTEFLAEPLRSQTRGLAYATRGNRDNDKILLEFELKEGLEDIEVTIRAEEEQDTPDQCTITVEVSNASGELSELDNFNVLLKQREQILKDKFTSAFGEATFENVNVEVLDQLSIEIISYPSK